MNIQKLHVKLTLTEPLLGSANANPELHREFIASKAPAKEQQDEEVEALNVTEELEKATMIFPKDETGLMLWNYQLRGFLKEAIGVLIEIGDEKKLSKWTYKRAVDSLVFVSPRRCYLKDAKGEIYKSCPDSLTRPLRGTTMQGDRVALITSQQLPVGTNVQFLISWIENKNGKSKLAVTEEVLRQALDYGCMKGLGQWRGGGFGTFSWEELQPPVKQ